MELLLEREEALATQRLGEALHQLGDGLCSATDVRAKIRGHPLLSTALGAAVGFVGGPALLRTGRRILGAISGVPLPGLRSPHALPGIVLASLRSLREPQ